MPIAEIIAAQRVVASVRSAFPREARLIEAGLRDGCYDVEESPHIWLERFSQLTTNAIKEGQQSKASEHFKLLSALLADADEPTTRCIDTAYVESLLWDIKDKKAKSDGWQLIPCNLRSLYIAMWGERSFMHSTR